MLGRSVESDKGLLPPGRAVGLLDLELELEFLQSNQPLPMGVICAVELLCLHLLVKLASAQPVLAYLLDGFGFSSLLRCHPNGFFGCSDHWLILHC